MVRQRSNSSRSVGAGDSPPEPILRKKGSKKPSQHRDGGRSPLGKAAVAFATVAAVSFCAYMGYQGKTANHNP